MKAETSYEIWLRQEGVPVVEGYGVENVRGIARRPWARTGGKGAFIRLKGMEGFTGMYVGEIPSGGALNPERHLYEELIYILEGVGSTEVWSSASTSPNGSRTARWPRAPRWPRAIEPRASKI